MKRAVSRENLRPRLLLVVGLALLLTALAPMAAAGGAGSGASGPVAPSDVVTVAPGVWKNTASLPQTTAPARASSVDSARPTLSPAQYGALKAEAARSRAAKPSAPAVPASTNQVLGQSNGTNQGAPGPSLFPPDTHGSVGAGTGGAGQVVTVTNSKISIYTKTLAPALISETALSTFFGYTLETIFDPQVQYDSRWDRWVVLAESNPEPDGDQFLWFAVSDNSTMSGPYIVRAVNMGGVSTFLDYPKMGLSQDAIMVGWNDFSGSSFVDGNVIGFPKYAIYNNKGFSVPNFGGFTGTVTPPNVIDGNPRAHPIEFTPAVGARNIEYRNPQAGFYGGINAVTPYAGESFAVPPDADQPAAPACAVANCDLDTLDGRFQDEPTQYADELWAVHTTNIAGFAGLRWYDFDTEGAGANTIIQSSFVFVSGTSDDFNPSIAAQTDGRAYMNWSYTDSAVACATGCPSIAFTGRLAGDPVNTENPPTNVFHSGLKMMGNYQASRNIQRWGDYSSIRFDPSIFDRAYLYNERVLSSGASGDWGSRHAVVRVIP